MGVGEEEKERNESEGLRIKGGIVRQGEDTDKREEWNGKDT